MFMVSVYGFRRFLVSLICILSGEAQVVCSMRKALGWPSLNTACSCVFHSFIDCQPKCCFQNVTVTFCKTCSTGLYGK